MVKPRDESARARFASELDRNFSVVASAGSGKTTAITQRVLSIARSPNAADILPHLVVVTFTNRAADEMQQRTRQALLRGKFATGSADCIQPRLLRHNPFVLHETPDRLRSLSWFACAARVSRRRRRPLAGVCAKPNSNWPVLRRQRPGYASAFRAGARPHGTGPTRGSAALQRATAVVLSDSRFHGSLLTVG